jgi:hypothetical protein
MDPSFLAPLIPITAILAFAAVKITKVLAAARGAALPEEAAARLEALEQVGVFCRPPRGFGRPPERTHIELAPLEQPISHPIPAPFHRDRGPPIADRRHLRYAYRRCDAARAAGDCDRVRVPLLRETTLSAGATRRPAAGSAETVCRGAGAQRGRIRRERRIFASGRKFGQQVVDGARRERQVMRDDRPRAGSARARVVHLR